MLSVWCVYWGDKYPKEYVHILKRMVERNLTIPHRFRCLTDQHIEGIDTHPEISDKQGWFQKCDLLTLEGENLYFDLDVVIVGNVDGFVGTDAEIKSCKNWAESGYGGVQSSVMYWKKPVLAMQDFDFETRAHWPAKNYLPYIYGDQEIITEYRDAGELQVDYFDESQVQSFKYHLRQGLTHDCRVAVFHGKPDPADVDDPWVLEARA